MSWHKRSFVLEVFGEGIYLASKDYLLKYGYESDRHTVPEIKVPKGKYEFKIEALKTPRGDLEASGILEVDSIVVLGDFIHVLSEDGYKMFTRDLYNQTIRGDVRTCIHLYTRKPGEFKLELSTKKI